MNDEQKSDSKVMPTGLARDGDTAIEISWNDGKTTRWTVTELRNRCPCASCRDQRNAKQVQPQETPKALPVLSAKEAKPLRIDSMRPVGSYAYNIAFSDGHSSGIFTFSMLYGDAS